MTVTSMAGDDDSTSIGLVDRAQKWTLDLKVLLKKNIYIFYGA